jgi:deoxyhypusine synthase
MSTDTLHKVQDTDTLANDRRKAELLSSEVEHIDIKSFDARPIVDAMGKMSFTSRDLARAAGIYNQMLADPDCSVSW